MRFILIFLLCFTFLSLDAQMSKKRGKVKIYHPNGHISAKGKVKNYKKQGIWRFWDDRGNLHSTAVYVNDTADGNYIEYSPAGEIIRMGTYCKNEKCGNWLTFAEGGMLISDENYLKDQMHGVQQFWYPNGNLREYLISDHGQLQYRKAWYTDGHVKAIETYRNNQPHGKWFVYPDPATAKDTFPSSIIEYKDGLRHGSYRTYSGSQLIEDFRYVEGKAEGIQRKWYEGGDLAMQEWYTAGKIDSGKYYINAIIARTVHFRNEYKHGPEVDFNRNGDTLKVTWWNNGLTDSSWTFHENGRRSSALYFSRGWLLEEATYIEWDTAGRKLQTGSFIDGRRHGEWLTYYPNGKKRSQTNYSDGKMVDRYTKWYPNGKKMIELTFLQFGVNTQPDVWNENGKPIKMGTPEYNEIVEGNKPGEIFSDASQYNRPIIDKRIEENRMDEESESIDFYGPTKPDWEPPVAPMRDTNEVFAFCELMPEFPGGEEARKKFIKENLKYPPKDVEGTVYIEYIVERDGSVTNVIVKKGIPGAKEFDQAAVDVVSKFPPHSPGINNGVPVRSQVLIPIRFVLR